MGGMSDSAYLGGIRDQSSTQKEIALLNTRTERYGYDKSSETGIETAKINAKAELQVAELKNKTELEAIKVEDAKSKREYKIGLLQAQNEAVRGEAAILTAQSKKAEVERKGTRDQQRFQLRQERQNAGYMYSP